jgi:DNA-binding MarR family transcriptional regulator/N-acetylglutamate synthase-like GNAT family acetyltransferase
MEMMMRDLLAEEGLLFLGSRLKRLGERMQADVARIVEAVGLPIQPAHYPLLAVLDRRASLTVGELATLVGLSQPAVTRGLTRLAELGLVSTARASGDARQRAIALTRAGEALMQRSKSHVWPAVEAAVAELCGEAERPLLRQIGMLEHGLASGPLDVRAHEGAAAGLTIRHWEPALGRDFHDINAEWIASMFTLEATDREVLENPEERIIAPGGDILFVEAEGLGIVGACALQKTGERQYELTKMGVRESARGRKAGEFLLRAVLRRARELNAETLYLLTSSTCAAAIHLYEKLGFEHDPEIMAQFGARYCRCNVAMRYVRNDNHSQIA